MDQNSSWEKRKSLMHVVGGSETQEYIKYLKICISRILKFNNFALMFTFFSTIVNQLIVKLFFCKLEYGEKIYFLMQTYFKYVFEFIF